jgi:predicted Zn finger-like uncharacterized protein
VKFLCDRCKTRYSIGDDRVRGKILKIRCKNCANVITVREGLGEPDEVGARGRGTTGSPPIASSAPANALGAAFAQQMTTKPPAALEEEWYVSIDGEQSGPFTLADAQRWITAKPHDADLHCWSEGFDDWLPVDKISHFRGLRKRPQAPSAPPPMPRSAPGPARAARGPVVAAAPVQEPQLEEDEPKPLFAATMAALERGVAEKSASQRANGSGSVSALPSAAATAPAIPKAMPSAVQAKSGSGSVPSLQKSGTGPTPAMPSIAKQSGTGPTPAMPSLAAKAGTASTKMSGSGPHGAARTTPGMSAGAKALAEAFDLNPGDSATAVEAQPFADELGTAPSPAPSPVEAAPIPSDDDMEIGEVSRVVKLADLAKMSSPKKPAVKTGRTTNSVPKIPIGELGLSSTPAGGMGALAAPMAMAPIPSESIVAAAPAAVHRRGMMILLGAAGLLLAGGIVAVVLLVQNNDETSTLNHAQQYDTNRPDEMPRPRNAMEAVQQQAALATPTVHQPVRHTQQITKQVEVPETPGDLTKAKIKPEEIEDIANKNAEGTKRCYLRAQKGALGIDIQDLKRIDVLFNVDPMGSVTSVSLSDHTGDQFGQCLIGRIKSWKFRASPGGQFKLPLVFGS